MASIPGSQFDATAGGTQVNVAETSDGTLPPPVPGQFNLEVWTGPVGSAPSSPAPGYDGLAILSDGGLTLDLISGAFAITDNGTGDDTINVHGSDETVSGGAANFTVNDYGTGDIVNVGGLDTITVFGFEDTVNGGVDPATVTPNRRSANRCPTQRFSSALARPVAPSPAKLLSVYHVVLRGT